MFLFYLTDKSYMEFQNFNLLETYEAKESTVKLQGGGLLW
jgi:hypothetical protein